MASQLESLARLALYGPDQEEDEDEVEGPVATVREEHSWVAGGWWGHA